MILSYIKFNESYENLTTYDRVICHGNIRHFAPGYNEIVNINVEGQTGIIDTFKNFQTTSGIVFDNYFTPVLTDLNGVLNVKRGLYVPNDQLEKISSVPKKIEGTSLMQFSKKVKVLLENCEYIRVPIYTSINYIDITDKNDTISYISFDRMNRISADDVWVSNLRQEMKIGRFLQIVNPHTNQVSLDRKINRYKSSYNDVILKKYEFRVVVGKDIIEWYREDNYQEGCGSLNKSCMRNQDERLRLYANNMNKISLLIMVNEENRLLGRAIIWKVDEPDVIYMDRPYTVYQEDALKFEDFAQSQGWKTYVNKVGAKKMIVYLNRNFGEPDVNPYMDTFCYFYIHWKNKDYYLTNIYDGGEIDDDYYRYDVP